MAAIHSPTSQYHAWLVRLSRERAHGDWRISLESVSTGERLVFKDFPALFAYIQSAGETETKGESQQEIHE